MAKEINIDINFNTKDAQSDVKNLAQDLKKLGSTSQETSKQAQQTGKDVQGMGEGAKKAGKTAKTSSKGWNVLGMAMKATGIPLLIGLIFKFSEVLMGNQRVMDAVNIVAETLSQIFSDLVNWVVDLVEKFAAWAKEMGGVKGMFNAYIEKVKEIGNTIKEFFVDSIKKTIEGLGMLGDAMSLVFQGKFKEAAKTAKEGVNTIWNANPLVNLTKKTIEYAKEVLPEVIEKTKDLIEKGKEYVNGKIDMSKWIVETRNRLTKLIGTLDKEKVSIEESIELTKRKRDNENLTFEERKKHTEELLNLEADLLAKEIELAEAKVEAAKAELVVNDDNLQKKQELALAEANLERLKDKDTQQVLEQTQAYQDLHKAQIESIKEIEMLNKFGRERELEELDEYYKQLLEKARKAGKGQAEVLEHYEMKKKEIRKKYNDITLGATAGLFGALAGMEAKGSKKWKKMAKAQALINTYLGVTKALSDKEMPFIARMLNSATQMVMGMNNVKAINDTEMEGADDEGGDEGTSGVSLPVGQGGGVVGDFEEMIPNQLSEQLSGTGATPVQAYVVETDISSSQALQEELNLQSTL